MKAGAKVIGINEAPLSPAKRAAIVDEFGELDAKIKAFKPVVDRHSQLKKQIAGWFENQAVDQAFSVEGQRHSAQISARAFQRVITSMVKLKNALGLSKFLAHCKFGLSDLDRLVPTEMHSQFVDESQTGARTVTVAAKFSAELLKAS